MPWKTNREKQNNNNNNKKLNQMENYLLQQLAVVWLNHVFSLCVCVRLEIVGAMNVLDCRCRSNRMRIHRFWYHWLWCTSTMAMLLTLVSSIVAGKSLWLDRASGDRLYAASALNAPKHRLSIATPRNNWNNLLNAYRFNSFSLGSCIFRFRSDSIQRPHHQYNWLLFVVVVAAISRLMIEKIRSSTMSFWIISIFCSWTQRDTTNCTTTAMRLRPTHCRLVVSNYIRPISCPRTGINYDLAQSKWKQKMTMKWRR